MAGQQLTDDPMTPVGFDDLYHRQWWPMLRLAVGLVDDTGSSEDGVQDAFAAVYRRRGSIASCNEVRRPARSSWGRS